MIPGIFKRPLGLLRSFIHPPGVKEEKKGLTANPENKPWPHDWPQVFFLHIPKTAGTSLRSQLTTRFDQNAILHITGAAREKEDLIRQVDAKGLVTGHVGFGLVNHFSRRRVVLTFLRDPLDRAISSFYYHRSQWLAPSAMTKARDLELLDFIEREPATAAYFLGNVQTSLLQSTVVCRWPGQEPGPVSLEQACANLESCACVGLTERMADSVALMCATLGWEPFSGLHQANRTLHRPAVGDLDQKTLSALGELTALDQELYRFGRELLARRWQDFLSGRLSTQAWPAIPLSAGHGEKLQADRAVFTFEKAIGGNGWYGRENDGQRWYCWTGPDRLAWIDLAPVPPGPALLHCHVAHVIKPHTLDHLQLLVNGQEVAAKLYPASHGYLVTAAVPAALLALDEAKARITIRVPEVFCPARLDPRSSDSRWLGVALDRLELLPAA